VAAPAQAPPGGLLPGQSATLMPNGRWLLLGGQGPNGPVAGGAFFDPRTGNTTSAPWTLVQPRAWHTATLLPDGAILVVGGRGAGAQVLGTAPSRTPATSGPRKMAESESFHPQADGIMPTTPSPPRMPSMPENSKVLSLSKAPGPWSSTPHLKERSLHHG